MTTFKKNKQLLKAINEMLKVDSLRALAYQKLNQIESDDLAPKNLAYWNYLKGKYYRLIFDQTQNLLDLETANDYLDDMAHVSYEHDFKIEEASHHFTRAYVKYVLVKMINNDYSKLLFEKALKITETGIKVYPKNSSFKWLKQSLLEL